MSRTLLVRSGARDLVAGLLPSTPACQRLRSLVLALTVLEALAGSGCSTSERAWNAPEPPLPTTMPSEQRVADLISEARDAVGARPRSAATWGRLGMVFDAHDYLEEAVDCYRQAHHLDRRDFRWPYHLGVLLSRQAAASIEIERVLRKAASLEPLYAPTYFRLSVALQREGRLREAQLAAQHSIDLDPDLAIAWRQLGQVLLARDAPMVAVRALERSIEREANDDDALSALAEAYRRVGDAEAAGEASEAARRAGSTVLLADPLRAEVGALGVRAQRAYERGRAALEAGEVAEAITLLEIKNEVGPSSASIHLLGVAHRRAGNKEAAIACFERAADLDDRADSHWQLGSLLIEQGRTAEAIEHLLAARNLTTADAELFHAVGTDLARAGHVAEAIETLARSAALDPSNESLETEWCGALLQLGRLSEALSRCQRAIDLDGTSARAHFRLGRVLEAQGRRTDAREHYQRALELDPTSRPAELIAQQR